MKKILLIKSRSQYGAMKKYVEEWNTILQKMGHKTYMLDTEELTGIEDIWAVMEQILPDIVLTCNAMSGNQIEAALPPQGRQITVLYDNPVYHHGRLCTLGARTTVFSCDGFYAQYIRENYPNIGTVGFLPLSGSALQNLMPYEERPIDLLFTGSYFDLNQAYNNIQNLPASVRNIALALAERLLNNPSLLLWEGLEQIFRECGASMAADEKKVLLSQFSCIDLFLRAAFRDQILQTIVDADIPIHIYGNGWEKFPGSKKSNFIWNEGYGDISLKALTQTKISLNIMPWFRDGIQERNISAMLSGALSLTDSSRYIEEQFQDGVDIALYSLTDIDKLPDRITTLLENTSDSAAMARRGYEKASQYHTWECRVRQMLAFSDSLSGF